VQRTRGLLLVLAVLLIGWMVAIAVDLAFAPLPQAVRLATLGVWSVAVLWAAVSGFAPSFRRLDLVKIARWLEHRHPEIEERLSTALEVSKDGSTSGELVTMLLDAAEDDAVRVDPMAEVTPGSSTKRRRWVVIACVLVFLASLIALPKQTVRLMWRAIAPLSDVGNAGALAFTLEPAGLEVLEGDAIEIRVTHDEEPEMVVELESGELLVQPMVRDGDTWLYRLEPARESFRYWARSGRAESDAHQATVWPIPRLVEGTRTLTFPAYTDLAPSSHGLQGPLEAVVGTELKLEGLLNTAVESAWIDRPDGSRVDVVLETSAVQARVTASWRMTEAGTESVAMMVRHRLGREVEVLRFDVTAVADESPVVVLLQPARREIRVRPDEAIDLRYEVTEDHGVDQVRVMVNGKGTFALNQPLPERIAAPGMTRYRGAAAVSVGEVLEMVQGASHFRLRVMAEDARPADVGGPGRGYSEWLHVKVDQGAESLARQELRSAGEDARKTLDEAMQKTREAEQKIHQNRGHLEKAEENQRAEKLSEETVEKLAAAEELLEDLAKRMDEGIHAKESPKVDRAAEKVEEALEAFEEVPLQDDRGERKEKLDQAVEAAREAVKEMQEVRRALEKSRPQVEDLARMEELKQQQEELARQAQGLDEEEVPDSWKKEQEKLAAELRSQLGQRPEAMAEALKDQAAQAESLADEAEDLAEAQQDLEKMVSDEQPSAPPTEDELRAAIADAQSELAAELKEELADTEDGDEPSVANEESVERAEQAADALASEEKSVQEAAGATREAAEAMQAANQDAGEATGEEPSNEDQEPSLGEQQVDRQEHLAEAAEALAEGKMEEAAAALAKADGDAREAAEEQIGEMLAEVQAEIASEAGELLAEARQSQSPMADLLPESVSEAEQAAEAFDMGDMEGAASEAAAAQTAMEQAAAAAEESGEQTESAQGDPAAMGEALAELAERQEAVADAARALDSGAFEETLQQIQEMQAGEAQALSEAVESMASLPGTSLSQAEKNTQQGSEQAAEAMAQSKEGEMVESAQSHGEASEALSQAAESLDRAAEQMSERAEAMAQRKSAAQKAPLDAAAMAEAHQAASEASAASDPTRAADQAEAAAQSLAEATQAARSAMRGESQPGPPGPPDGMAAIPGGQAGEEPSGDQRSPQPDPGVPEELAKLGISASDWEKIQASLQSDVGARGSANVPEDYRELVRDYFNGMAK